MYGSGFSLNRLGLLRDLDGLGLGGAKCPMDGAMFKSSPVSRSLLVELGRVTPCRTLGAGLKGSNSGLMWPFANASPTEPLLLGSGDAEREPDASEERSVMASPFMGGEWGGVATGPDGDRRRFRDFPDTLGDDLDGELRFNFAAVLVVAPFVIRD